MGQSRAAVVVAAAVAVALIVVAQSDGCAARRMRDAAKVRTGADVLVANNYAELKGYKVGLLGNPTTVLSDLTHLADAMHAEPGLVNLVALFGAEHGFRGDQQGGSGTSFYYDNRTGLPVYNTYSSSGAKLTALLDSTGIDTLIFDIQDVGTRFYTYVWSLWDCMVAAAASQNVKRVVVLDRPNPLGGVVMQGPLLQNGYSSFIGRLGVTLRHGMTVGELATMFHTHFFNDTQREALSLGVVPMQGWTRDMTWDDTGLTWIMPSPNMPLPSTAYVYPGLGILEGTTIGVGRGTTRPFEISGAPFLDWRFGEALRNLSIEGADMRVIYFIPTSDVYANNISCGVELHNVDVQSFDSLLTAVSIITLAKQAAPSAFRWNDARDFDLHMGTNATRLQIDAGMPPAEIVASWQSDVRAFAQLRAPFLLYN